MLQNSVEVAWMVGRYNNAIHTLPILNSKLMAHNFSSGTCLKEDAACKRIN